MSGRERLPYSALSPAAEPARSRSGAPGVRLLLAMVVWMLWGLHRRLVLARLRADAAAARAQACRDPLTGLGNRAGLHEVLAHAQVSMLAIVDLDDFKPVNDRYGHHVGDHVLQVVGRRFQEAMAGQGSAFRLGGDEFALVWHTGRPRHLSAGTRGWRAPRSSPPAPPAVVLTVRDPHAAGAEVLARSVDVPVRAAGESLNVGASLGVAVNDGLLEAEQLLRMADAAMYEAKARPRTGMAGGTGVTSAESRSKGPASANGVGSGDPATGTGLEPPQVRTVHLVDMRALRRGLSSNSAQVRGPKSASLTVAAEGAAVTDPIEASQCIEAIDPVSPVSSVTGGAVGATTRTAQSAAPAGSGRDRTGDAQVPAPEGSMGGADILDLFAAFAPEAGPADHEPDGHQGQASAQRGHGGMDRRVVVHPGLAERRQGPRAERA